MMPEWTSLLLAASLVLLLLVVLAMRKFVALRMEDPTIRDPMTGVYTTDFIKEVYRSEARRADRTGVPFSVVLVALRRSAPGAAAVRLHQQLRGSDYLGRLPDNRFIAILPETWADDAQAVAARIAGALQLDGPHGPSPGCHIAVATWRPELTDIWAEADLQLRHSAAAGGD